MWRSVSAVAVGFVLIGLLATGTDMLVRTLLPGSFGPGGRTDSVPVLLLTVAYVGVYAVFGCWLAARLAPDRPMRHAMILGALGLLFNVAGTFAMWDTAPAWYHVTALALVLPFAWLGGRIRERQVARQAPPARAIAA